MKNDLRKPILVLQRILIALMLCYPICAFHLLPGIGDGERYYIRLLLPLALLILGLKLWTHHLNAQPFKEFGKAILPWVLTIAVLMAIHHRGGFSSYLVLPLVAKTQSLVPLLAFAAALVLAGILVTAAAAGKWNYNLITVSKV